MNRFVLVLGVVFFSLASHATPAAVQTKYGAVQGVEVGSSIVYEGIPYAAPPTGALRWHAPQEPQAWTTPLNANQFSQVCPQLDPSDRTKTIGSEDCLKLNIWGPQQTNHLLPVMLFLHGGGNTEGSGYQDLYGMNLYDGSALSADGVVIVTINYRLGELGFLAHNALRAQDGQEGNYGILDQIQALKFVRDNIKAFGGDPSNVTVFGESAGAIDALVLVASPLAKNLFNRAIIESGFLIDQTLADAETSGLAFAKAAGCNQANVATCLRALTPDQILKTTSQLATASLTALGSTIDGVVLKQSVLKTIQAGQHNHMPIIIGTNHDEMRTLATSVYPIGSTFADADYLQLLTEQFGATAAAQIHGRYQAAAHGGTPLLAFEDAMSDYYLHCPARTLTHALLNSTPGTYRYMFSHVFDNSNLAQYGAGHGLELPYVFGTMSFINSAAEVTFSGEVRKYWTAFALSGNPAVTGQVAWPTGAGDTYMDLNETSQVSTQFHQADCDFWAGLEPLVNSTSIGEVSQPLLRRAALIRARMPFATMLGVSP
jgi:para-nitrobenzyl esterase